MQIAERDWKHWRRISEIALQRYCAHILDEVASFQRGAESAHDRYLHLFHLLRERDQEIAAVFNDRRRSNAYQQIAAGVAAGIVSREELGGFSEETQSVVRMMLGEA